MVCLFSWAPGVESLVVYMITGNRKRNAATFIISNSPTALFEMQSKANRAIIDNINNYIIGKVADTAIEKVCQSCSLSNCAAVLKEISSDSKYQRMFILKINGRDTALVKQCLPESVAKGPIFKTRDTEKT